MENNIRNYRENKYFTYYNPYNYCPHTTPEEYKLQDMKGIRSLEELTLDELVNLYNMQSQDLEQYTGVQHRDLDSTIERMVQQHETESPLFNQLNYYSVSLENTKYCIDQKVEQCKLDIQCESNHQSRPQETGRAL